MKRLILLLSLLFVGNAFGADTVYAWGYGDILEKTLIAVKFTFAQDDFTGLFKFALLIAFVMAIINSMSFSLKMDFFALPKLMALSMGISALFVTAKIDVVVNDVNTNTTYPIFDVPWAVAKPLVWVTGMEKELGEMLESSFAVPGDISYTSAGFLSPFNIMNGATSFKISDPYIFQSLDNYIIDCVMPDIQKGYLDVNSLANTEDLWGMMSDANPAVLTMYYSPTTRKGEVVACTESYTNINGALSTYLSAAGMQSLGGMLGGYSSAQLTTVLGSSANFFMGYTKTASDFLLQSTMINQFTETYKNWATINGTDNGSLAYGTGKGEQTAQANMIISGVLGAKYIPVIKGILTVILIALTPIVALLLLTPMFFKVLTGYLSALLWLSLWHVGEVLLNFIIMTKASSYILKTTAINGVQTIVTKPVIDGSFMDYINMAGSMYWMIPAIAGLIVGGFGYMALSGLNSSISGGIQSGPRGVASEVASGSASFGNFSANNTNANKHDSTNTFASGNATMLKNAYGEDYGYTGKRADTNLANQMRINGENVGGAFTQTRTGDGNIAVAKGAQWSGKDGGGSYNASSQSGFTVDKDGKTTHGTVTKVYESGNTVESTYDEAGKEKKRIETTKGGAITTTEVTDDGKTVTYQGAAGTIKTQDGVEAKVDLPSKLTESLNQSKAQGQSEQVGASINRGINNILTGQETSATQDALIAQQVMNNTKIGSKATSQERAIAEQAVANAANSITVDKTHTKSSDFKQMTNEEFKTATEGKAGFKIPEAFKAFVPFDVSGGVGFSNGNSMVFSDGKGNNYSYALTENQQKQFNESVAKSYVEKTAASLTNTSSFSDSDSSSNSQIKGTSLTTSQAASAASSISKQLTQNYIEELRASGGLDTGALATNRLVGDFVNENYKTYAGGKEAMHADLVAGGDNGQKLYDKLNDFARERGKLYEPQHVLSEKDRQKIKDSESNIAAKTAEVEKKGNDAFTSANNDAANNRAGAIIKDAVENPLAPSRAGGMNNKFAGIAGAVDSGLFSAEVEKKINSLDYQGGWQETSEGKNLNGAGITPMGSVDSNGNVVYGGAGTNGTNAPMPIAPLVKPEDLKPFNAFKDVEALSETVGKK